jgi:NADPH:quinone reductase-like Zn-dependent oxidoreductase
MLNTRLLKRTRSRPNQKASILNRQQQLAEINRLIDEGKLKIYVETVLPLTEVKKVHQLSQSGRTRGKIVLQVGA